MTRHGWLMGTTLVMTELLQRESNIVISLKDISFNTFPISKLKKMSLMEMCK